MPKTERLLGLLEVVRSQPRVWDSYPGYVTIVPCASIEVEFGISHILASSRVSISCLIHREPVYIVEGSNILYEALGLACGNPGMADRLTDRALPL